MRISTTSLLLLSGLALGGTALAAQPANGNTSSTGDTTVFVEGVKVAIDPATGRIRPITAAEIRALSAAMSKQQASSGMRQMSGATSRQPRTMAEARATRRRHADGSVSVRVPSMLMTELRANKDAAGNLHISEGHEGDAQQPITLNQQEATQ